MKVPVKVDLAVVGPEGLGLKRFKSFRPQQITMAKMVEGMKREFLVLNAPTGTGKSLGYTASAVQYCVETGERALVVLKTKQLQDQYGRDFGEVSRDLRGKGNYPCVKELGEGVVWDEERGGMLMADKAPCREGKNTCELMWKGCPYYGDVKEVQRARLVSTNYHLWMSQVLGKGEDEGEDGEEKKGNGWRGVFGEEGFGLIVMDEVHGAGDALCGYMSVEFGEWKYGRVTGVKMPRGLGVGEWKEWAGDALEDVKMAIRRVGRGRLEERHKLGNLKKDLEKFVGWVDEGWVAQRFERGDVGQWRGVKWMPVWPGKFFRMVTGGAKKVVMTSATISKKTVKLLGVEEGEMEYREFQAAFDKKVRPVFYSPAGRVDSKGTELDQMRELRKVVERVAVIARRREGRSGLVHTVSYKRALVVEEWLREMGVKVVGHGAGGLRGAVERFRGSERGTVLVSPSASEGVDLPYDMCRWQAIVKVPFPDTRDLVTKKRTEDDSDYPFYLIAQEILQMCGRVVRAKDDFGETFILDSHWGWVQKRVRPYMPEWFLESVMQVTGVPGLREL